MRGTYTIARAAWAALALAGVLSQPIAAETAKDGDLYAMPDLRRLQDTFAALADQTRPAVVSIRTFRTLSHGSVEEGDLPVRIAENQGSGVILDAEGHILTNEHVVRGGDKIEVVLHDGTYHDGRVVRGDERSDLAIIRIDAEHLTPAQLGDIAHVRPGHWSFTVGNPFGLAHDDGATAFSVGNVTALGKSLSWQLDPTGTRYYGDLVQTSAPINPGNSGGPLFNLDGEVIGICTAMLSSTGANEGLGFAIPVNDRTRRIIETLRRGERVQYGYLGVKVATPTKAQRERAGMPDAGGAFISAIIEPDGPAAKAGLQRGDVVARIDGAEIADSDHLVRVIGATPVGSVVDLLFYRDGRRRTARVRLAERPLELASRLMPNPPRPQTWEWDGVLLGEPTDTILSTHGLTRADAGLVVIDVEEAGAPFKAGVRMGQVIMQVNGKRVRTLGEFQAAARRAGRSVELTLEDDRVIRFRR
ncbi:MAG: trypsin-like peptidase domain-containing protein [Phycisphaerae bacterium]|nr:trypsin-like peptidase domain-containing protein [Phycisphaerae bacterium]